MAKRSNTKIRLFSNKQHYQTAFALVEILIVVAILGILAAIVIPEFQGHSQAAKESAAKDNLRILRNTIELYALQHDGVPPGYSGDDPSATAAYRIFELQTVVNNNYLSKLPENPFNNLRTIKTVQNGEDFPAEPVLTDLFGWIYKPESKIIKLNWSGIDSQGTSYFDY